MDENLLDKIYAAAAIPELWKDVLQQLSALAGGHAGALIANRKDDQPRYVVTESYGGQKFHEIFQATTKHPNPRPGRALRKFPMGFGTDLELCTEQELQADPIYSEGLRPNGFEWSAGTAIPVPSGDIMVFDLVRRTGSDPFDRAGMEALDVYRPHLARSALMSARLQLAQANAANEAFERMGLPSASVGVGGKVVAANTLFTELAPRIRIGAHDKIEATDRLLHNMLLEALRDTAEAVRSLAIPASSEQSALIVHILPVRQEAHDIFNRASALLVVTPVTLPNGALTSVITGLFDLTSAEARIASGIAGGLSVQEIARSNNVSTHTVRTQLKSVFIKTGVSRQADLVLLLSGSRLFKAT